MYGFERGCQKKVLRTSTQTKCFSWSFENMEKHQDYLKLAEDCAVLKEVVELNKKRLDAVQDDIESRDPGSTAPRSHIEKASGVAANETLKHNLAKLQAGLKPSDQYLC